MGERAELMTRRYRLGTDFPGEGFVQAAVEEHFRNLGFAVDAAGDIDLLCRHSGSEECWHIEVKGKTSAIGLDFRTCLVQLVQRMTGPGVRYGMALPDIPQYRGQIGKTSQWAVRALGITWLLVQPDGGVHVIQP